MKRISTCNVPEDENNLVKTRLGGEIWASDQWKYLSLNARVRYSLDIVPISPLESAHGPPWMYTPKINMITYG